MLTILIRWSSTSMSYSGSGRSAGAGDASAIDTSSSGAAAAADTFFFGGILWLLSSESHLVHQAPIVLRESLDKKFITLLVPRKATGIFDPLTREEARELRKKHAEHFFFPSQLSPGKCCSPHSEANNLECWDAEILVRSSRWRFSALDRCSNISSQAVRKIDSLEGRDG